MGRALVRWVVAVLVAIASTYVVLVAIGAVSIVEAAAVLAVALPTSWYFIVRRPSRRT